MTEKRFTVPLKYSLSHSKIQCDGKPLTNDELVRILNTNDGAFLENFKLKYDKYEDLTVESARDVLNELVKAGYGDYELLIGYDSNLAYTGFTDDIEIDEKSRKVIVKE